MKFNLMNFLAFIAVFIALSIYMDIFNFGATAQFIISFLLGFFWANITGLPIIEEVKEDDKKP